MHNDPETFDYDAFISYSHNDSDWVQRWLGPRLVAAGVRVCIDVDCFEPGEPSLSAMERAVLRSRKTVLVLTPSYFASDWAEFENIMTQTLDPSGRKRRLIPLLLVNCDLPLRIRALTHVNM